MELLTMMAVVRDRHTEGGMMITNHDHHTCTTVTKHRFPHVAAWRYLWGRHKCEVCRCRSRSFLVVSLLNLITFMCWLGL
eukprot:3816654-Prymnesium_polylepis.2